MKFASRVVLQITGWIYDSRRRIATAGVVVLAAMVGFHVIFGANGVFVYTKKRAEYRNLETELKDIQQENDRLNQNIKSLRTDPRTIEKEAREQLRYARPGEVIYALPAPKPAQNSTAKK